MLNQNTGPCMRPGLNESRREVDMSHAKRLPASVSLVELESAHEPPCLSLYQPTHRRCPEKEQDPIRFHNLVKEREASLRQKYPAVETRLLLRPFEALAHDHDFWTHTLDGRTATCRN